MEHTLADTQSLLGHRFKLLGLLGEGSQGRTYRAQDVSRGGRPVAIKELDFRQADSWKAIELFDREAQVLKRLDHPGIPAYVDAFHKTDRDGQERFFLAQDLVDGVNLQDLMDSGHGGFTEEEAHDILRQVLEILVYLQERSPPVIHRDIKPSNLMRRPDGSIALIDFGAVQSVLPGAQGGSTIIGTTGYMPVEQLMGRAGMATDVYALGATMAHLLSGRHPSELPVRRMTIDLDGHVNVSPSLRAFLDRMLKPDLEDRFPNARAALNALMGRQDPISHDQPAVVLMSTTTSTTSPSNNSKLGKIVASVLFLFSFVGIPAVASHCGLIAAKARGYHDVVMEPLLECSVVEDVLGQNPRFTWKGNTSAYGDLGNPAWRVPVEGSKARGTYNYRVSGSRGNWTLQHATLFVDWETYYLLDCDRH